MAMNKANKTLIGILQSLVTTSGMRNKVGSALLQIQRVLEERPSCDGFACTFFQKKFTIKILLLKHTKRPNSIQTADQKNPN
jgi:hypothetical protein